MCQVTRITAHLTANMHSSLQYLYYFCEMILDQKKALILHVNPFFFN